MTAGGMTIRAERRGDEEAIYLVQLAAFGTEPEARIVAEMRATDRFVPELSLVAEADGEMVGHVLVTYADLETPDGTRPIPLLGPIGVVPERQGQGIGSALVRAAFATLNRRGEPLVVLEGNPKYYSRFGFVLARELAIAAPPRVPERYFQAAPLRAYEPSVRGSVRYPAPFAVLVP